MNWTTDFSDDVKQSFFTVLKTKKILHIVILCQMIIFLIHFANLSILPRASQIMQPDAEGEMIFTPADFKIVAAAAVIFLTYPAVNLFLIAFILHFFLKNKEDSGLKGSIFKVMGIGAVFIASTVIIGFILMAPLYASETPTKLQIFGSKIFGVIFEIILLTLFYLISSFAVLEDKIKTKHFKLSFDAFFSDTKILFAAVSYFFVRHTILFPTQYFFERNNLIMIFASYLFSGILLAVFLNFLSRKAIEKNLNPPAVKSKDKLKKK